MTHSPEPWKLETGFNYEDTPDRERWVQVLDAHRKMVLYDAAKGEHADQILADLERITACVNACAGIPTGLLKQIAEQGWEKCQSDERECSNLAQAPHICPFEAEIHGNETTLCNCCKDCEVACRYEI